MTAFVSALLTLGLSFPLPASLSLQFSGGAHDAEVRWTVPGVDATPAALGVGPFRASLVVDEPVDPFVAVPSLDPGDMFGDLAALFDGVPILVVDPFQPQAMVELHGTF